MKRYSFFLLLLLAMTFAACNKYPDGPSISLRTKKTRLANSWVVDSFKEDGVDKTTDFKNIYAGYLLSMTKDGSYTVSWKPYSLGNYVETGSWSFDSQKIFVTFTSTTPSGKVSTWKVTKLEAKELWARINNSNGTVDEVHLIPEQ